MNPVHRFDPRGALAVVSVLCAFAIQGYLIYLDKTDAMPVWIVGLVMAIVSFYFGYKAGGNGGGKDSHDSYAGGRTGSGHTHKEEGEGATTDARTL